MKLKGLTKIVLLLWAILGILLAVDFGLDFLNQPNDWSVVFGLIVLTASIYLFYMFITKFLGRKPNAKA